MNRRKPPRRILAYEAAGFLAILAIVFLDEIFGYPEQFMSGYIDHPDGGNSRWKPSQSWPSPPSSYL